MLGRVLGLLGFALLLVGCGGSATTAQIAATKVGPDLVGPRAMLDMARGASAAGETRLLGKDYSAALGYGHVAPAGDAAKFSPGCTGVEALADSAYAIYTFELPDYDGLAQLTVNWDTPPANGKLWLGLSNFSADCWEWFSPADPGLLDFSALDPYFSESGMCFAVVLVTGDAEAFLAAIQLGEDNETPTANFAADVLSGTVPLTVNFDASASTDPGTGITLYEWDWNGDGTYDQDGGDATASHVFETADTYTVILRVTGSSGSTDTAAVLITAGDAAGWQQIVVPPGTCQSGNIFWDVAGHPAVAYSNGYSLAYRRALDAEGETWGEEQVIETIEGRSFRQRAVGMVNGDPAVAWFRHVDSSSTSELELHFSLAQDAAGGSWGAPVTVAAGLYSSDGTMLGVVDAGGRPALGYDRGETLQYQRANDASGTEWGNAITVVAEGVDASSSLELVADRPAVAYADYSSDPYGYEIRYLIANDAAGTTFAAPAVALARQTGQINWMALADIKGRPGIAYGDMQFVIGSDSGGSSWSEPTGAVTGDGMPFFIDLACIAGQPAIVMAEWTPYNKGDMYYSRALDPLGAVWPAAQLVTSIGWTPPEPPFFAVGGGMVAGRQAVYYGGHAAPITLAVYKE
ncbi:PKD domain-containing protein [bacterium]|nr:PKD domain-containing protein [bacterium]